jgi:minichromosome maintenance protein 10
VCRERVLPHEELQEHLTARHLVSPSQLYSLVRPVGRNGELEVPVVGDWITIGVLAEKSEIRFTNPIRNTGRQATGREGPDEAAVDDEDHETGGLYGGKAREEMARKAKLREKLELAEQKKERALLEGDGDEEEKGFRKPKQRRYVTFKLVDLGTKGAGGGSGVLDLRLFEADSSMVRKGPDDDGEDEMRATGVRVAKEKRDAAVERRQYKGGSGGAYEKFWKEREGAVIALLNPRIMKPREVTPPALTATCATTDRRAESRLARTALGIIRYL